MLSIRLEQERPGEWLRWLAEEPDGYALLLRHAGGLAQAAYRLARARCRAQGSLGETPTLRELRAAALTIAERVDGAESVLVTSLLATDCEEQGLAVIRPLTSPPSTRPAAAALGRTG
jgi:hypothetical protein